MDWQGNRRQRSLLTLRFGGALGGGGSIGPARAREPGAGTRAPAAPPGSRPDMDWLLWGAPRAGWSCRRGFWKAGGGWGAAARPCAV